LRQAAALGLAGAICAPEGHLIVEHKELAAVLFALSAVAHVGAVVAVLAARLLVDIDELGVLLAFLFVAVMVAMMAALTVAMMIAVAIISNCLGILLLRWDYLAVGRGDGGKD